MALASSNRAQVRYIKETNFGVTPTSGNPKELRITGESLDFAIQTETSKELRFDRQTTDVVHVGASASGGVNLELSYKEYDDFMEATLQSAWVHYGTDGLGATGTVSFAAPTVGNGGTITWSAAPTGTSALNLLEVGQWVKIIAPTDVANGQYVRIKEVTSTTILTIDEATPINGPTFPRNSVTDVQLKTSRLKNGVTQPSFSIEKQFAGLGAAGTDSQFFLFRGMTASQLDLSFQSAQILGGSITFMGKDSTQATATQLPGTPVASQTFDVMNAVSGVGTIIEDGVPMTGSFIKSLSLSINNNLREQDAIGTLGAVAIAPGTIAVSGNMELYLDATAGAYNKFRNNLSTSISFFARDPIGNGYAFTMPKIKFTSMTVQAGGLDTDVMLSAQYQALMGGADNKTITVYRL